MKRSISIAIALMVVLALAVPAAALGVRAYSGIPTFSIVSVITDQKVTIQTDNFPASYDFQVLMGPIGTQGIGGTVVDTTNSGTGGAIQVTYAIPDALKGSQMIAIRLQSTTGGFFAYNWFTNTTATVAATTTPASGGTGGPVYTGFPTIDATAVVVDSSVTLTMTNLPINYDFNVLMGAYGTLGVGGTQVATFNSGAGGAFSDTYITPDALKGAAQLAIRIQSTTGGYFAYTWFNNNVATPVPTATPAATATPASGGTGGPVYTGIPTFAISAVVKDSTVSISAINFPVNYDFTVLMGLIGTKGVGGTQVATFNSGAGGDFTATTIFPTA